MKLAVKRSGAAIINKMYIMLNGITLTGININHVNLMQKKN